MNKLIEILMERDECTLEEARDILEEAREAVYDYGENPEDVLLDYFGLEPDFIFDLLGD